MKVLMTGASGFIGSNVLQYLLNNTDWYFTCICSFKHKGNPLNIPLSNRVSVITLDLRGKIPDIGNFDYILHLASESHVDRSIQDPVNFIENNISSTLNILEYAREHKPEKFLLFSTDEVYGAHAHYDYDIQIPTNPYSASKSAQESIAIAYYNTYNLPIIITNSNNIVGPNQDPEKFIPKLIQKIKTGKTIELHQVNKEYGKRFYNPVENIGSALQFILEASWFKDEADRPPRYSLTGGECLDNYQMAKLIADILGIKMTYTNVDVTKIRPTYDKEYVESDDDKLTIAGWTPPVTLEKGLRWIKST